MISGNGVSSSKRPSSARARARRAMTESLAGDALDLFEQRGYDATSIDDICRAAEVSRTTFFRYFPTKEDALMGPLADVDGAVLEAFRGVPDDARPWRAVRSALDEIVLAYTADAATTLRILNVFGGTPSLGAFHQAKVSRWVRLLETELFARLRLSPDPTSPGPAALLGAAFACLDAALTSWAHSAGAQPLPDLLDSAIGALREVSPTDE